MLGTYTGLFLEAEEQNCLETIEVTLYQQGLGKFERELEQFTGFRYAVVTLAVPGSTSSSFGTWC